MKMTTLEIVLLSYIVVSEIALWVFINTKRKHVYIKGIAGFVGFPIVFIVSGIIANKKVGKKK